MVFYINSFIFASLKKKLSIFPVLSLLFQILFHVFVYISQIFMYVISKKSFRRKLFFIQVYGKKWLNFSDRKFKFRINKGIPVF